MTPSRTAERIATAAREILIAEGMSAVTMRRVAAAAGVTTMATYRHYANREALLREVGKATAREVIADWDKVGPSDDLATWFNALLDRFLDFALGQPNLYRFLMIDRWEQARRFPEDFHDGGSPFMALVRLIEKGMRDGLLHEDDALEVALTISTHSQGMILLYLNGRIGLSEKDFRAMCHRTAWRIFDGIMRTTTPAT